MATVGVSLTHNAALSAASASSRLNATLPRQNSGARSTSVKMSWNNCPASTAPSASRQIGTSIVSGLSCG